MLSDKRGENYLIAKHIIIIRGAEIKGYLGGISTHNTIIERLWIVMDSFFGSFINLEESSILNRNDNLNIWVLYKLIGL